MIARTRLSLLAVPLAAALLAPAARAEQLTVEEAVEIAIERNPALEAANKGVDAANDNANSVRGHYLPAIAVSDEWQHYNSPFSIPFSFGSIPGLGTLPAIAFPVRDIDTNTLVVAADQPLLGLLRIGESHAAAMDQGRAAGDQAKAVEAGLREAVETQFLRLYEARAMEDIARSSQGELNDQLGVARSKLAAGVLTNADVLRVRVAVANAREEEIEAKASEEVSRAVLLADLGMPPTDDTVDFAEPTALENAPPPPALPQAVEQADTARPELAAVRAVQSSAEHARLASVFKLLPDVDLEGAYEHITGQVFAEKDSEYFGIKASWAIWEWGADYYAQKAASETAEQAAFNSEGLRDNINADLSSKLSLERAATVAVDVAQTAIASAEEAFRVEEALVKAGSATTTDLLDSQSALTQAKLNLVRARYEQAIARVAVKRAIGA